MNDLDALCLRVIFHGELQFQHINIFTDPLFTKKFQVRVIRDHNRWTKKIAKDFRSQELLKKILQIFLLCINPTLALKGGESSGGAVLILL